MKTKAKPPTTKRSARVPSASALTPGDWIATGESLNADAICQADCAHLYDDKEGAFAEHADANDLEFEEDGSAE